VDSPGEATDSHSFIDCAALSEALVMHCLHNASSHIALKFILAAKAGANWRAKCGSGS